MDKEWKQQHVTDLNTAKVAIWTPAVNGDWRPSSDIIDKFDWKDKVVVDFGCGVGRNLEYLFTKECAKLYGYDHPEMLTLAFQYLGDRANKFIPVTAYRFEEIPNGSVDTVFCSLVLQHLEPDPLNRSLEWFTKILKNTGKLIVFGRDCGDHWQRWHKVKPFIAQFFNKMSDEPYQTEDIFVHSLSVWMKK